MKPFEEQMDAQKDNWTYAHNVVGYKEDVMGTETLKGTQFKQPLLEFSGACAGCGETPYVKLITQLYGEHMMVANATGCSSIWGGSAPATFTINRNTGNGPTWANSLFEDNAEFGFGMHVAVEDKRNQIENLLNKYIELGADDDIAKAGKPGSKTNRIMSVPKKRVTISLKRWKRPIGWRCKSHRRRSERSDRLSRTKNPMDLWR